MQLELIISESEILSIKRDVDRFSNDPFYKNRLSRNLNKKDLDLSNEYYWQCMVICLMTSANKSGKTSRVVAFKNLNPFPLSLQECLNNIHSEVFFQDKLKTYTRFYNNVARQLRTLLIRLEDNNWEIIRSINEKLSKESTRNSEFKIATQFQKFSKKCGFGLKQTRNLFQTVGLFKYEIPIDSRILKWLSKNKFPIGFTNTALQDPGVYAFILDFINNDICNKIGITPSLLDAAIFLSFEKETAKP